MGYNYELNVGVSIYPNVYKKSLKFILEEHAEEWGQKADSDKNMQYVWVHSDFGELYFQRLEVIRNGQTEEEHIISQNTNSLKSGETNGFLTLQQEIIDAKDNIEEFLREIGYSHSFQLDELMISYAEQESPYMK